MTALVLRERGTSASLRLALPLVVVGLSVATGAGVSLIPQGLAVPAISPGLTLVACPIGLVVVGWALIRCGHRAVASVCLYASALALALPSARVTEWMTASDLFLLAGGTLLVPEILNPRRRSSVQRGFVWAVTLIVVGGLLGTIVADEPHLSLLNLVRLATAAGATLVIFVLWAPSAEELRRFLVLVIASGLVTSVWALTHTTSHSGRASGFSGHPNHLALVCLVAIGPAIAFSLVRGSPRTLRIAAGGAAAILVGAIVVSGSRSGLIGLGGAVIIALALMRGVAARAQLAMGAAVVAAAAMVGFSALTTENAISRTFNRETPSAVASDSGHRAGFSEMAEQIRRNPITGVGFSDDPLGGHDAYLQLWAAGGIIAFLGGVLVIGSAGAAVGRLRLRARLPSVYDRSWPLLASTLSLSGLVVALTFQNALWNRYIWVTVALVAASSAVTGSRQTRH